MKNIIIIQILLGLSLLADITMSVEEEKNWKIQTLVAKEVSYIPMGEYIMSVTTPPKLLHTLSVPYEAQVVQLNKVSFEKVEKSEPLALLTATKWIETQKEVLSDVIELMHHEHIAERKAKLCKEEVIAQKECYIADAEVQTDKIKLSASKTLLKAYGASDKMLERLFKELKILPTMELLSPVEGVLLQVNIQPGKSISPSSALFVIKVDGDNWLESDLPQKIARRLHVSQEVKFGIDGQEVRSKILHISPVLNAKNQTRHVRFSLPADGKLLSGLRTSAKLSIKTKALLVNEKAVVQDAERTIVFIKKAQSYKAHEVGVIAENEKGLYLKYDALLKAPIVMSRTSVLQSLLNEGE